MKLLRPAGSAGALVVLLSLSVLVAGRDAAALPVGVDYFELQFQSAMVSDDFAGASLDLTKFFAPAAGLPSLGGGRVIMDQPGPNGSVVTQAALQGPASVYAVFDFDPSTFGVGEGYGIALGTADFSNKAQLQITRLGTNDFFVGLFDEGVDTGCASCYVQVAFPTLSNAQLNVLDQIGLRITTADVNGVFQVSGSIDYLSSVGNVLDVPLTPAGDLPVFLNNGLVSPDGGALPAGTPLRGSFFAFVPEPSVAVLLGGGLLGLLAVTRGRSAA